MNLELFSQFFYCLSYTKKKIAGLRTARPNQIWQTFECSFLMFWGSKKRNFVSSALNVAQNEVIIFFFWNYSWFLNRNRHLQTREFVTPLLCFHLECSIVNANCQFSHWVPLGLVLFSGFYRLVNVYFQFFQQSHTN